VNSLSQSLTRGHDWNGTANDAERRQIRYVGMTTAEGGAANVTLEFGLQRGSAGIDATGRSKFGQETGSKKEVVSQEERFGSGVAAANKKEQF
jgi:hypothetical protein